MSGITLMLLGGAKTPFEDFAGGTISRTTIDPVNATASLDLLSDGTCTTGAGNNPATKPNWFTPTTPGVGSSYWCKATIISGSFSSGSTSLQSLSGGAGWTRSQTTIGTSSVSFTLEIFSDSGGTQLVASVNVTLTATKDA